MVSIEQTKMLCANINANFAFIRTTKENTLLLFGFFKIL
jgi:hypothetical protein